MTTIETGTNDLLAENINGVGVITLNRPDARNAMSGEMNAALSHTLAAWELDPAIKCIILTGAGKGFCAGGDVKGMAASGDGTVGDNTIDGAIHAQRVTQRATAGKLFKMPKPTIAALPGAAAGAGLKFCLGLRSPGDGLERDYDHGVCARWFLWRLWRHLFHDPAFGHRQGSGVVLFVRPR